MPGASDCFCHAGVHHVEKVVVFQVLVGRTNRDRCFPCFLPLGVESLHVIEVTARAPQLKPRLDEVVERRHARSRGPGHDKLADVRVVRRGKRHDLLSLGRDGQVRSREIPPALHQPRQQLVTGDGDEHDRGRAHPSDLLRQVFLEVPRHLGGEAPLIHPVEREEERVVDGQYADEAALDHAVQVSGPRFVDVIQNLVVPAGIGRSGSELQGKDQRKQHGNLRSTSHARPRKIVCRAPRRSRERTISLRAVNPTSASRFSKTFEASADQIASRPPGFNARRIRLKPGRS